MSISVDTRSFKNPADKARKLADYKEYLKLQQKLNTQSELANKAYAKGQVLGLKPTGPSRTYASAEEALQDVVAQREEALQHLRSIFPYGEDASRALTLLDATTPIGARGTELNIFNQSWSDFQTELKGMKNISVPAFETIWNRYKEKIAKTNLTGINIPIDDTTFNQRLNITRSQIIKAITTTYRFSQKKLQKVKEDLDRAVANRDSETLETLLSAVQEGNDDVVARIISQMEGMEGKSTTTTGTNRPKGEMSTRQLKDYLKQLLKNKKPGGFSSGTHFSFPGWTGPISRLESERGKEGLMAAVNYWEDFQPEEAKEEYGTPPETPVVHVSLGPSFQHSNKPPRESITPTRTPTSGSPDLLRSISRMTEGYIGSKTPSPLKPPSYPTTPKKGKGLYPHNLRRRVIVGNGIKLDNPVEKYQHFGRYVIHMPSLKKNKLNLKFPSLGYIPNMPITHVSDEFKDFIYDLLETERITPHIYNKMSKEDKALFDRVAVLSGIDDVLGLKVEDLEKKEAMKRFEILRGELVAGNDNQALVKEFKTYLIKFMNENIIPRREGQNLLLELMCMG